jgi:hypothetical protein
MKTILAILIALSLVSCDYSYQFLRGYSHYSLQNDPEDFKLIEPLVIKSIRRYEDNFGWCKREIMFIFREYPFTSAGRLVGGSVCGYDGNAFILCIGVDPNDECMTAGIIAHELYHACKGVWVDDNSWIDKIEQSKVHMRNYGECISDPNGLYNPYPFE